MKTPMQELIEQLKEEKDLHGYEKQGYFETAIELAESMLEKEKEMMQEFATDYERECRINLERSIEKCWDTTFNTKENENIKIKTNYCRNY